MVIENDFTKALQAASVPPAGKIERFRAAMSERSRQGFDAAVLDPQQEYVQIRGALQLMGLEVSYSCVRIYCAARRNS